MDDKRPVDELTEQQLAEVIRLVTSLGDDYVAVGFTTAEYCRALGVEPDPARRAYREALRDLKKLMNAGLLESGVRLSRRDVHGRNITTLGWRVAQTPPERPLRFEEEGPAQ
jgi:uroporphyrinogen-III synthase